MFGNTHVIPHADGNITAVKINQDGYTSEYLAKASTYEATVRIRHSNLKPDASGVVYERHNVEYLQTIYAAGAVPEFRRKVYVVFELLKNDTDVKLVDALADWLIASSNANVTSLINKES